MSVTAERKKEVITQYAKAEGDTGSPEVQVAVLSERIANLTEHFKTHSKDNHSRRGLIKMVSQRRRLLDYVKASDSKRYDALISRLGLRRCARSGGKAPFGLVRCSMLCRVRIDLISRGCFSHAPARMQFLWDVSGK